jgi:hypothetical protein
MSSRAEGVNRVARAFLGELIALHSLSALRSPEAAPARKPAQPIICYDSR